MSSVFERRISKWTFGAEHEFADWDRRLKLPRGFGVDERDVTIVNSDGTAADPKGKVPPFGGEFNTPPTGSPAGQVTCLLDIIEVYPNVQVNYRSNLHVHVRVPRLREDLTALKRLQLFCRRELPKVLDLVETIPHPTPEEYPDPACFAGAMRRYRRRCVSHHTVVTEARVERQMDAQSLEEFLAAEVPSSGGRPMWHLAPRAAINLRQLRETDTIEFRHFPGTLNPHELRACADWCGDFLAIGLGVGDFDSASSLFASKYAHRLFPKFPAYIHWMEVRYRATVHDGTISREEIARNVKAIQEGSFNDDRPLPEEP